MSKHPGLSCAQPASSGVPGHKVQPIFTEPQAQHPRQNSWLFNKKKLTSSTEA